MPTEKGRDIDRSTFIPFSASRTTRRSLGRYVARCCTTIQMLNYDNRRTDDVATQIDSNTHHLQHGSERPWLSQGWRRQGEMTKLVTSPVWASSADGESGQP